MSWPVGALLAAGATWLIGKTALGLRSDYLAIATLGIGEIIVAVLKNEDWLARGVKNVIGIPRPSPTGSAFRRAPALPTLRFGADPEVVASTIVVSFFTPASSLSSCWR